ncbi:MAG: class I SAM-dependent methyltransferase [Gammaproteobacteria bacterium]|jgi:predicted methyltransferase|nr:class I SAM-dependent methyltransferase [Gammaproteobacteria bacterium]MBT5725395.1 class I SAM-dependent methyltransferase [Gammaproteobacteria bacterium]MBT6583351.1 class I SAM-dependent methyltransferase [Gammaproteobacteria bacterium]MBT6891313.1 class I SAM-dependent methyltransferase [Gammaproteobacteria bacterium]
MRLLLVFALTLPIFAGAAEPTPMELKIQASIDHDRRTDADRERDRNRQPKEVLTFVGLQNDMHVLELLPGSGWYTKILGPVLEENGKLYLSIGTNSVSAMIADKPGFSTTEIIPFDGIAQSTTEEHRATVPEFSFGVRKLDLVLTFRNLHNFDAAGRANLNAAAFEVLNKGGRYAVVDHTRRHMQPDSYEVWRRIDPVQVIKEVQAAGFKLVDYSDLHYKPDDELRYEVGRKTVTGNTDRFTLLFEKP